MVTHQQFGNHVGISRQAAGEWFAKGKLPKDGTLDECRLLYCQALRDAAAGRSEDDEPGPLDKAKVRLTEVQAEKTELEVAALKGSLIPAALVEQEWGNLCGALKSHLRALPTKLVAEMRAAPTELEAEAIAKAAVDKILEEFVTANRRTDVSAGDVEPDSRDAAAAPKPDDEPVGGPAPVPEPRRQRRARKV